IVYINGETVGMSKDTRLPCEFDITDNLIWKDSKCKADLLIEVIRYSDASFVEDQDQWWFGGIHRSVYLYSTEKTFIQDVEALTSIKAKNTDKNTDVKYNGELKLAVTLGSSTEFLDTNHMSSILAGLTEKKFLVKYTLHTLTGTAQKGEVGKLVSEGCIETALNFKTTQNQARDTISIQNVNLWSHEIPYLYVLTISLYDSNDKHIQSVACTIGFKSVEVKNKELLINGKKVYIKGVNRHEHNEKTGKTLTLEDMIRDCKILKSYNFNAVRTCHYPDDERWYDLCDRYGIYIMDEANLENHAYYDSLCRSDDWTEAYMKRVQRMVRRDKNHACIFCWSLGNESGDGPNQVACSAWVRRVDSTRIIHYEGFVRPEYHQAAFTLESLARGKGLTDLICPMYPDIDLIVKYARECDDYRPIIMCEYSHAMGNANGSLSDYWKAIENTKGLQGGFIWDWIDQGIAAEKDGKKYWKYGGDFGEFPHDADFCLNGLNFPDMTPKPAMEECRKLFAPVRLYPVHPEHGSFEVENRFNFINLDFVRMNWCVIKNGKSIKSGTVKFGKVKPGEKVNVLLPQVKNIKCDVNEEIVFKCTYTYKGDTWFCAANEVIGSDEIILNKAEKLMTFPKAKGEKSDTEALTAFKDFIPNIFRPMIENEVIKRTIPYRNHSSGAFNMRNKPANDWLDVNLSDIEIEKDDKGNFILKSGKEASKNVELGSVQTDIKDAISPTGLKALEVNITMELPGTINEYPRAGITFKLPASYKDIKWYGRGPQECYSDRKQGALLGLYEKAIKDLSVPYIVPQQNGDRCDTRYLEFIDSESGKTLHIQSFRPFSFCVSPYTEKDLWKCEHTNELSDTTEGEAGFWTVAIDAAHRGVGTGACGPDTLEKYRVRPGIYRLNLLVW
ncbi:MAG: DUF4981 domain-containing protein, partial [Treponema sp.]|nr:DUF4981 domain-containing protein [Treponema sp.]